MSNGNEPVVQRPMDDEIDLFELFEGLMAQKYVILAVLVLSLIAGVLAIQFMKPVYKASAYILSPLDSDLHEMNKLRLNLVEREATRYTPKSVFDFYLENLQSRELKKELFEHYNLGERYAPRAIELPSAQKAMALERATINFGEKFTVSPPKKTADSFETTVSLSVEGLQPAEIAAILNDQIARNNQHTINQIYGIILSERLLYIQLLTDRMAVLRKTANDRRSDRIAQLDEAIKIARKLNIAEPRVVGPHVEVQGIINQGLPIYYLGYRLLEAEKETIDSRENHDPFIDGLRELQGQVVQLETLQIDAEAFRAVRVAQAALPPTSPEKPKPKLIIALSGVLGLMVGVFVALIRLAFKNRRARVEAQATV